MVVRAKGKKGTAVAAQILRGEGGPQAVGQGELESECPRWRHKGKVKKLVWGKMIRVWAWLC